MANQIIVFLKVILCNQKAGYLTYFFIPFSQGLQVFDVDGVFIKKVCIACFNEKSIQLGFRVKVLLALVNGELREKRRRIRRT